jgi:hypothetical protein
MRLPHTLRSLALLSLSVSLAACASTSSQNTVPAGTPTPDGSRTRDQVTVASDVGGMVTREVVARNWVTTEQLTLPPDRVYTLLSGVFQGLGLTVIKLDPTTRAITGELVRSRRPFGGKPFVQLLDCGETAGVPIAGRYDINLTVMSKVNAVADGSAMDTEVEAMATPNTTQGNQVRCRPNERISQIIAQRIRDAAANSK